MTALVKDVMRKRIKTIKDTASVKAAARIMEKNRIGSVVVLKKNKIVGIVTKTDIVYKHVAKGKRTLKEIMTKRPIKISSNKTIEEAAKTMTENNIEKLLVFDKGKVVGIISITDILKVEPALFTILLERLRQKGPVLESQEPMFGVCEACGNYSDELREVNGLWVCPSCAESKE